jgi:S1-C subfamily serine protease
MPSRMLSNLRPFTIAVAAMACALSASAQDRPPDTVNAVVKLRAEVPPDARSARTLGSEREGNGILIDSSGLIVTIGYLIMEAMNLEVTVSGGKPVPADWVGYDYETGFGLVRARTPLGIKPAPLGRSQGIEERTKVWATSHGGTDGAMPAIVVGRRTFAGYWEYMVNNAIFTSPPLAEFGGAGLFDLEGRLIGVGSLFVQDALRLPQGSLPGNMFVPIDDLKPIFSDMLATGRAAGPSRPWLGLNVNDHGGQIIVVRVTPDGPAYQARLQPGDVIVAVGGEPVKDLGSLWKKVWGLGEAGVEVPLSVRQDGGVRQVKIRSVDRYKFLKLNPTY